MPDQATKVVPLVCTREQTVARLLGASLPVLLAGSIVRVATLKHATWWLAMSTPCTVRAKVFTSKQGFRDASAALTCVAEGRSASPRRLGKHLYVVTHMAVGTLAAAELLACALTFEASDGQRLDCDSGFIKCEEITCGALLPTSASSRSRRGRGSR
jgi:hypothetical protein